MRITAINQLQSNRTQKVSSKPKYHYETETNGQSQTDTIAFKSIGGKVHGSLWGAFITGSATAILTVGMGPIGAAITILASEIGGGYIGSKIGDKLTGKDKE